MRLIKATVLLSFDAYIYIFFVYPLWNSLLITLIFFLPMSLALLYHVTHTYDGQDLVNIFDNDVLSIANVLIRFGAFVYFRKSFNNMDIIMNGSNSPFLFFMSALVGIITVFTTFMLLYNFLAWFGLVKSKLFPKVG
jgi:hypothetical protein